MQFVGLTPSQSYSIVNKPTTHQPSLQQRQSDSFKRLNSPIPNSFGIDKDEMVDFSNGVTLSVRSILRIGANAHKESVVDIIDQSLTEESPKSSLNPPQMYKLAQELMAKYTELQEQIEKEQIEKEKKKNN